MKKIFLFLFTFLLIAGGKLTGFAREFFVSYYFGVSIDVENFVTATYIGSLIYIGFYSAINLIIIPKYSNYKANKEQHKMLNDAILSILFGSIFLTLFGIAISLCIKNNIINLNFDVQNNVVATYILITSLSFFPSSISAIYNSLHVVNGRSNWAYIAPLANNLVFIILLILFGSSAKFYPVLLGGLISWIALSFASVAHFYFNSRDFRVNPFNGSPSINSILSSSRTIIYSYLDGALIVFVVFSIGSEITNGASIFNYAYKLVAAFTSIFSVIMSNNFMGFLASRKDKENYQEVLLIFKLSLFVLSYILPLFLSISYSSKFLTSIIYGRGQFNEENISLVALIFSVLCLSLPIFILKEIYSKFFFSRENSIIPLIGIIVSFLTFYSLSNTMHASGVYDLSLAYVYSLISMVAFMSIYLIFYGNLSKTSVLSLATALKRPIVNLIFSILIFYIISNLLKFYYPINSTELFLTSAFFFLAYLMFGFFLNRKLFKL